MDDPGRVLDGNEQASEETADVNEETALLDDLFILKESLVSCGSIASNALSYLSQIFNMLEDFPSYAHSLARWGFLTKEALYALRTTHLFPLAIRVITQILQVARQVPELYLTKKFVFFVTDRLYASLRRGGAVHQTPPSGRDIVLFVTEIISIDKTAVRPFYDAGFFILANTMVTYESCALYNTTFRGIFHYSALCAPSPREYTADALYEIQRKFFDAEIVFREKEIIELKKPLRRYRTGVYESVYGGCTNMRHFMELDVKECLDMMLYRRIVFMNDSLDLLIREKNSKAIAFYRRSLEEGAVPDTGYVLVLQQALENKEIRMDAAISLYYLADAFSSCKGFTEQRIRCIFECLEYHCEPECNNDAHTPCPAAPACDGNAGENSISMGTVGRLLDSTCDMPDGMGPFDTPADVSSTKKVKIDTPVDKNQVPQTRFDINRCNRVRVVKLIKELYLSVDKRFFYKPSYLILMRNQLEHARDERAFIDRFFRDFLSFMCGGQRRLAQVVFPAEMQAKAKKTAKIDRPPSADPDSLAVYELSGEDSDLGVQTLADKIRVMKSKAVESGANQRVKIVKNVVVSSSEDEIDTSLLRGLNIPGNGTVQSTEVLNTSLLKDLTAPTDENTPDRPQ